MRTLRELYGQLDPVATSLDLTQEGMRYYAHSVIKSQVFQISRRSEEDRYLHLICFVANQFFRLQDMLVDAFLLCVQSSINTTTREYKEVHYEGRTEQRRTVRAFAAVVKQGACNPLAKIEGIVFSGEFSDSEKVHRIQDVLTDGESVRKTVEQQASRLSKQSDSTEDAPYYDILESKSVKLQNRVSEILKEVEFESDEPDNLMAAILFFKEKNGQIGQTAPLDFLEPEKQELVTNESGKLRASLYKSLLFIKVANAVKAGALNVRHSYKYRSLDNYLIDKETWKQDRDEYLTQAELTTFSDCQSTITRLADTLDAQFPQN